MKVRNFSLITKEQGIFFKGDPKSTWKALELLMTTSDIHIRPIEPQDFNQITDLYYRYLAGDFIGSCGRRVFQSYLKELYASPQGSICCAVIKEDQVIGFTAGVVNRERFNRQWLWRNLVWLGPVLMVKFFFSSNFRRLILTRLQVKFRDLGEGVRADSRTDISRLRLGQAMSLWVVVDEAFRGGNKDVASRLITSLEQDLKGKGATRVYGFITRTNLASVFAHLKNGWQITPMGGKNYLVVKDL